MARYDLGLTDDNFYALTPRQLDALLKRRKECMRVETLNNEFMLAQLTSWVANTGFRSTAKPTTWKDFAPSEWSKAAVTTKRRRMTKKRRAEVANAIRIMFPNLTRR